MATFVLRTIQPVDLLVQNKLISTHSGLEQIQKKKNVTKTLSMVLKPFEPTDFKMLKQKIGTKRLHEL